jgi:hypothetical protein
VVSWLTTIEQRASVVGVDKVSEPTPRQALGHRINKENTHFDVKVAKGWEEE